MEFHPNIVHNFNFIETPKEVIANDKIVELKKLIKECIETPNGGSIKRINAFIKTNEKILKENYSSDNKIGRLFAKTIEIRPVNTFASKAFEELSRNIENIKTARPENITPESPKSSVKKLNVENAKDWQFDISQEQLQAELQSLTLPPKLLGVERHSWNTVEATAQERAIYLQKLQSESSDIYKCGVFRNLHNLTKTGQNLTAEKLPNGKTLEVAELHAIKLFSTDFFKIINQGLRNHPEDFATALQETNTQADAESMRAVALECATMLSSGLNKLPNYEGLLMKGGALRREDLEKYQPGNVIIEKKIFGGSIDPKICKEFATGRAQEYPGCIPVIMCWESKQAKSIENFSYVPSEAERIYPPGQGLQVLKVEDGEGEFENFKIIFLKEIAY